MPPLHIKCNSQEDQVFKPFRFFSFWLKHPQFKYVIEDNWRIDFKDDLFIEFHAKLKKFKAALVAWSRNSFGNIFQKRASLEDEVKVKEIQLEINPSMENRVELNKSNAKLKKY